MSSVEESIAHLNRHAAERYEAQGAKRAPTTGMDDLVANSHAVLQAGHHPGKRSVAGARLGQVRLSEAPTAPEIETLLEAYFDRHGSVHQLERTAGHYRVEAVKRNDGLVAKVQQYVDDKPVTDGRFTAVFDRHGYLTHVTGAPFCQSRLAPVTKPELNKDKAIAHALEHNAQLYAHKQTYRDDYDIDAQLCVRGADSRLIWEIELSHSGSEQAARRIIVDAESGRIEANESCCERGAVLIPVRHYRHKNGLKQDTATRTRTIWVDPETDSARPPRQRFSLQRLGAGRARIWNARGITAAAPLFKQTWSDWNANGDLPDLFETEPGSGDAASRFNEQQTFYYAQWLKTYVDNWGRKHNDYGHFPVDRGRDVNVDIVVNGDSSMEQIWANASVMHGAFRNNVSSNWFEDHPRGSNQSIPVVYLFNSAGNKNSPEFIGPEFSPSYSIIAHEVGHFISWQYGSWKKTTLNEGHSMVLAALMGKERWPALDFTASEEVTTGSFIQQKQWSHTPKYLESQMTVNDYHQAWPFTQAMWNLMNNRAVERRIDLTPSGQETRVSSIEPFWADSEAALKNTADLFMYSLYTYTDDSTVTWHSLCDGLLVYLAQRIQDGKEKGLIRVHTHRRVSLEFLSRFDADLSP